MLNFILSIIIYLFTSTVYAVLFVLIGDRGYIKMQRNGWEPLDDNANMIVGIVAGFVPILRPILFTMYLAMLTMEK